MASEKYVEILRIGPFKGLDASTADEYIDPKDAQAMSNVATDRFLGGFATARGRKNLATLTGGGTISALKEMLGTTPTGALTRYILAVTNGATPAVSYDIDNAVQANIPNIRAFKRAARYGGAIYTDAGQQIYPWGAYEWQQNAPYLPSIPNIPPNPPTDTVVLSLVAGTSLPAQNYRYAFTQVTTITPTAGYKGRIATQETSPNGSFVGGQAFGILADGTHAIQITLQNSRTFNGTNADGSTYATNIYRSSDQQPAWFLVGQATGTTFVDGLLDTAIAANIQLDQYRDAPPPGFAIPGNPFQILFGFVVADVISYKNRLWVFCEAANPLIGGIPQAQLWFSDYGVPFSFNRVTQVLLVGSEDIAGVANNIGGSITTGSYDDAPVGMGRAGSYLICFKRKSEHLVYGQDASSYTTIPLFKHGCLSAASITEAGDVCFWLTPSGPFLTDAQTKLDIGIKVKTIINAVPLADRRNAVGFFRSKSWFLSFPASNFTLRYYVPTQDWFYLPYATNAADFSIAEPVPGSAIDVGTIYAARPNSLAVDLWDAAETDLGQGILATWQDGPTDSGRPQSRKSYRYILIQAPVQTGTATVKLFLDNLAPFVWPFDLSLGPTQVVAVPQGQDRGFVANLELDVQNTANATAPLTVNLVCVGGTFGDQDWVVPM